MIRPLHSNTTLEVRIRGASTSSFTHNRGSSQGNGISNILFNIHLQDALQRASAKVIQNNLQIKNSYSKVKKISSLRAMIYTGNTDILNTHQ